MRPSCGPIDGNNWVEIFNSAGNLVSVFGGGGSGAGQFARPEGIAIASNGNMYVADNGHGRVEVYNSAGNYVLEFGLWPA
jgi:DNA-binding beta-propeller fold protein YncE